MNNCWMCGNIANSKEHKIKKSLLKKIFSEDFENKNMIHIKYGVESKLPGPNSDKIKFKKVICEKCNNDKTQNHDKAFDIFINYLIDNTKYINKKRMLNFEKIYGDDFVKEQLNLYKYFVKIIGCDLSENDFNVPFDLKDLLDKDLFKTKLKITFSINEIIINSSSPNKSYYGNGDLITTNKNKNNKNELNAKYRFEIDLSYLRVNFFYNTNICIGSEWITDKQYLYLGSSVKMNNRYI